MKHFRPHICFKIPERTFVVRNAIFTTDCNIWPTFQPKHTRCTRYVTLNEIRPSGAYNRSSLIHRNGMYSLFPFYFSNRTCFHKLWILGFFIYTHTLSMATITRTNQNAYQMTYQLHMFSQETRQFNDTQLSIIQRSLFRCFWWCLCFAGDFKLKIYFLPVFRSSGSDGPHSSNAVTLIQWTMPGKWEKAKWIEKIQRLMPLIHCLRNVISLPQNPYNSV